MLSNRPSMLYRHAIWKPTEPRQGIHYPNPNPVARRFVLPNGSLARLLRYQDLRMYLDPCTQAEMTGLHSCLPRLLRFSLRSCGSELACAFREDLFEVLCSSLRSCESLPLASFLGLLLDGLRSCLRSYGSKDSVIVIGYLYELLGAVPRSCRARLEVTEPMYCPARA